jgi:glycosyltransferase involved in cell wall biosynthesis
MPAASLKEIYSRVTDHLSTVFVVPLIRHHFKQTDYLYLLYKELIENQHNVDVVSISASGHFKFVVAALFRKPAILHYHWLEFQDAKSLIGMPYKLICIWLYCVLGGKLIWTVHNLTPHDKKYLKLHKSLHRWMASKADVIHVHSEAAKASVSDFYNVSEQKVIVLKHPEFPSAIIQKNEAKEKVIELFGYPDQTLAGPVFLVFGGISEYKGIRSLILTMKELSGDFTFIIAGYVKKGQDDLHRFIVNEIIDDHRFIYTNGFIPEQHYPFLLSAADVCPFNYSSILTSGGIEMARSYDKTIIAPRLATLAEYESLEKVHFFDSPEELKTLLQNCVDDHV